MVMTVGVGVAGVGLAVAMTGMRVMLGNGVSGSAMGVGAAQAAIKTIKPIKDDCLRKWVKSFMFLLRLFYLITGAVQIDLRFPWC